jgi:hypothetical protein
MARPSATPARAISFLSTDSSDSSSDSCSLPEIPTRQTPPPLRLFDRYLNRNVSLPVPQEQLCHYIVHRRHYRKKGIKRKLFQITDCKTSEVLAGAKFASVASNVLKVSNRRGLVCEVDMKTAKGPFIMRLGIEPTLVVARDPQNSVSADFLEFDEIVPPYSRLVSHSASPDELVAAFGNRRALESVKNCRLCLGNEEIVAVRKVHKNRLEVDSKRNLSFLSCFVIALFMFLSKP